MNNRSRWALSFVLLLSVTASIACSGGEEELVFADWVYPPPEGTPIKEHPPVPLEGRDPNAVQLIDDLIIGSDTFNEAALLFQPSAIAVDAEGNVYVADRGTSSIKVYGEDGTFAHAMGKEGQGPGEFSTISSISALDDGLLVWDSRNSRFSKWAYDGTHLSDVAPTNGLRPIGVQGLADGTAIAWRSTRDDDRNRGRRVYHLDAEGNELHQILDTPMQPPTIINPADGAVAILQSAMGDLAAPTVSMRVGGGEVAYLSPMNEYQILAYSPDGSGVWALRTAWRRLPYSDARKQPMVDSFVESFGSDDPVSADDIDWPEHERALMTILTDDVGRIYAFPTPANMGTEPPEEYPVDVYSPAGEFIAAGVVPHRWTVARDGYVYGLRTDDLDETIVVRYRLSVNGQ